MLTTVLHDLLSFVAPARCAGCDAVLARTDALFCGACAPLLEPHPDVLAGARNAAGLYLHGGPLAEAIERLKYRGQGELGARLGALFVPHVAAWLGQIDGVIPMPLHPRRLRERGYNQAALLARPLAKALAVPMDVTSLERARDTGRQVGRDAVARAAEMRGAFRAASSVHDRAWLVVDDVRTTGATLAAAAATLREAGARRVVTIALAVA